MSAWPVVAAGCAAVAVWCWPAGPRPVLLARRRGRRGVLGRTGPEPRLCRSRPDDGSRLLGGLVVDLVAAALDAGLPPSQAVTAAVLAVGEPVRAAETARDGSAPAAPSTGALVVPAGPDWDAVRRGLLLSDLTGVPAATLLRDAAGQQRAARRTAAEADAARLGVGLVLPLGLTVLPSFVLLGVAPVVLGLARGLLQG